MHYTVWNQSDFVSFKEDEESPVKAKPDESDFNSSNTSLSHSSSKQELLENKQDLLSLKEEFQKLKKSLIDPEPASASSDDFQDFESYESQQSSKQSETGNHSEGGEMDNLADCGKGTAISHSGTCDSIAETHGKGYTPSMTSSGYGSQAVSTLTLSSEDSLSLRSNEDSDLHKMSRRSGLEHCSSGDSDGDDSCQGHSSAIRSEVIEEVEGQVQNLIESSSNETLENLNVDTNSVDEIITSKVDDSKEKCSVNMVENIDKSSLKSDLTEEEEEEEENVAAESVKLHISEEDLSATNKEDVSTETELSQEKIVQCEKDMQSMDRDQGIDVEKNADKVKCDISETENQNQVKNSSRSTKGSDSSSNASRGPLYSDSIDPYSLEAMEELEKLGDEFGPDNSEFVSVNETTESVKDKSNEKMNESNHAEHKDRKILDDSFIRNDIKPEHQSTPIKREGRLSGVRSEPKQRPVSCIVMSDNDLLETSLQEKSKRSSLDFSDEHLSGKFSCI